MSADNQFQPPSERRFGFTFMAALVGLGIYGIVRDWSWIAASSCLVAGAVFGLLAQTAPKFLTLPNTAWFYLGVGLGKIVSPIVLGIIFFGILTPISLLGRVFGRDELRLKRRAAKSYWVLDELPPRSAADSFRNQF